MTTKTPWLATHRARTPAARRLIAFPHAGGSASFFRSWVPHLDDDVELGVVQYPGREGRMAEPLVPSMTELATAVAEAVAADRAGRETVFFGHSMGAAVAYETLRLLTAAGSSTVTRLCVSGRQPDGAEVVTAPRHRTDGELLASMGALGGTRSDVLEDPDLRRMVLDIARNDYYLIDSYRRDPDAARLDVEVVALMGEEDAQTASPRMEEWSSVTTGPFSLHVFTGGHFYLAEHAESVVRLATATSVGSPGSRPVRGE
ncbi:alpha/beta fold hydrolase [Streptomyces sp. NPDC006197]|uniref:thioesterase II family protein n=1 Tax=Streptomyces sp. NPDC006197 TaxID=3156685 RepID=UPI0033A6D711